MKRSRSGKMAIIVFLVFMVIWIIISKFGNISSLFLPPPMDVLNGIIDISHNGYGTNGYLLVVHLYGSFKRLFIAFFGVVLTAIPLGIICGFNETVESIISPIIEFYRPLPPLAYYTLLVLWMGIGEPSKIMLLYLAGFAPLFIACVAGVKNISKNMINCSYMLGATKARMIIYVAIPAILPDIFTGLRTSLGVEYTTLVAAEMVAASSGIGWMVLDASRWLRSDIVFGCVIIMGITGILFNIVIEFAEKKIVHWKGKG